MLYKEFYSEVGKLLYAVADIDGVITQKEKKTLQDIVKQKLVASEKHIDKFGTDTGFYADMEFEILEDQMIEPEAAFESFIGFVEDNYKMLDENMKNACIYITEELANAYHGTNKKEKDLIEQLKHKLDKLELKDLREKSKKI